MSGEPGLRDRIARVIRQGTLTGRGAERTADDVLALLDGERARAPHPSEILRRMLVDRQLSPERAAELCGLHPDTVENLASGGGALVNDPVAEGLGKGLGPSAQWWLSAQDRYYDSLAAAAAGASEESA